VRIEVYQDTVCPWCRIGKRHLELALADWQGEPVAVAHRPFFLDPAIPATGYPFRDYMRAKGGGRVPLEQFFAMPRERGKEVGLTFDFEAIGKAPNTSLSHQLIALAPEETRDAVIDAVYAAYFEHGRDIGDLDVLVAIAAEQGLEAEAMRAQLAAGAARDQVEAAVAEAQAMGITGVPFFVIDGRYAFSGAQPPAAIRRMLQQVTAATADSAR
jgi:predicted DsbA family dithiol-disulfide isomerase